MDVLKNRLRRMRHVALDLDGTIYTGGTLFPFTLPFLNLLRELGIGHTFLSNNSSKSVRDYLVLLGKLGIPATPEELYTSSQATIEYLHAQAPLLRRLFVLGTPSLCEELREQGLVLTRDDPTDEPDAVVVGFDTTLVFSRLCRAAYWIQRGKPFLATHPDLICPTDQPTVLVDCGALCAALERATGKAPEIVFGKPDPCMIRGILQRHSLAPDELAVVGDRLYTDMVMARRAGALAVLVLTGETTASEAERAGLALDLVVADLGVFGKRLRAARSGENPAPTGAC